MEWGVGEAGLERVGRDLATEPPPRWWPHRELLKEQSSSSLATPQIPLPGTVGVSLDHTLDSPGSCLFLPDGSFDVQAPSQTNQNQKSEAGGVYSLPWRRVARFPRPSLGKRTCSVLSTSHSQPASRTQMSGWVFYLRTLSSPPPLCP